MELQRQTEEHHARQEGGAGKHLLEDVAARREEPRGDGDAAGGGEKEEAVERDEGAEDEVQHAVGEAGHAEEEPDGSRVRRSGGSGSGRRV